MPLHLKCGEDHKKRTREKEYEYLFNSKEDMTMAMRKLRHGNLYVAGNLWIAAMKSVLVGAKMKLVPTIEAAPPKEETPTRPPKMRYKDLCYYKSPHYEYKELEEEKKKGKEKEKKKECPNHAEYKEHEEDQRKCLACRDKILHNALLPHVSATRVATVGAAKTVHSAVSGRLGTACKYCCCKKRQFVNFMRHPDNYDLRRAVVAAAGLSGFIFGRRLGRYKDSLHKGLFWGGLGLLGSGALCFPKETDVHFRNFCYEASQLGLKLLNIFCWSNNGFRQPYPCPQDLPKLPEPKDQVKDQCKKDGKEKPKPTKK